MAHTVAVKRGCGTRVQGGIYAECGMSRHGKPVEHFLIDPPHRFDPDQLGLSSIGVQLLTDAEGTTHVVDWIGSEHYPNVADFLEEVRRYGLSRRLPKNLDYSRLAPGSRIIVAHARGGIDNHDEYLRACDGCEPVTQWKVTHHAAYAEAGRKSGWDPAYQGDEVWACPKLVAGHDGAQIEFCVGVWWEDVEPDMSQPERDAMEAAGERQFTRAMPSFSYPARCRPHGVTPRYTPALIATFPITNLSVIRAQDGSHEQAAQAVQAAELPFSVDNA